MEQLGSVLFIALDGDPPADLDLDLLPDASAVAARVKAAFEPFMAPSATFAAGCDGEVIPPEAGLFLVYAFGHAWLSAGEPQTAIKAGSGSRLLVADELFRWLVPATAADRTILVLDCCHAAAFDSCVADPHIPRLIVYASGRDEKAISLHGDQASRLSLALGSQLTPRAATLFGRQLSRSTPVDLVHAIGEVARYLDRDTVLTGQTVDYRMNGRAIFLSRSHDAAAGGREGAVARIRSILIGGGATAAILLVSLGWSYWSHVLIEIDLAGLPTIAKDIRVTASEEDPSINSSRVFDERGISGNRVRVWAPASNVLIRIDGQYADGSNRALAFHLDLQRGFDPRTKVMSLALPPATAVTAHPGMAFVPATAWFHGLDSASRSTESSYWIDIRPPTVASYLAVAQRLMSEGRMEPYDSYILQARQRSSAVEATGLGQLHELSKDLGKIFSIIEADSSEHVAAPGEIAQGLGELPCDTCPAPMMRAEAELYCLSRNLRLPTDLEWELAVRGVDGRVYPWGNRLDEARANLPGLPKVGASSPSLKPVDAYASERSPFGLVDTVGNAGDWVLAPYDRSYMGATYYHNPSDATSYQLLPITDETSTIREITARCVDGPQVNP
ncbi:SUMF1/EgtB/PvdO family nonheme iron enzyme [Xanthobacter flavus]|uniref:formylglycine-generating enzyme family protein n=1 Tax=Xanthobacter flavus TaxID=281 RepID=UPI00372C3065